MFDVSSITGYIENQKGELLAKSQFGAVTVDNVTVQTGVKGPTNLHILDVDVTFQDGSDCGFDAEGDDVLSDRQIAPKAIKVNKSWCDKTLIGTYAQNQIMIGAGKETLPFEEVLMDQVTGGIAEGVEKALWAGVSALNLQGYSDIIVADVPSANKVANAAKTNWLAALQSAYTKLPVSVLGKADLVCYMAPAEFEALVIELVNANLYHYNPNDASGEIVMPGTNVKILRTPGMAGLASGVCAVFARKSNLFYGTDTTSDTTDFDFWYSKENREFRLVAEFNLGVQIAFPSEVTYVTNK